MMERKPGTTFHSSTLTQDLWDPLANTYRKILLHFCKEKTDSWFHLKLKITGGKVVQFCTSTNNSHTSTLYIQRWKEVSAQHSSFPVELNSKWKLNSSAKLKLQKPHTFEKCIFLYRYKVFLSLQKLQTQFPPKYSYFGLILPLHLQ